LPLEPKTIQIEKVPETGDAETWANFNKRLNDLANQGYNAHACDSIEEDPRSYTRKVLVWGLCLHLELDLFKQLQWGSSGTWR